jgi:hypothetical protein
MRITKDDRAILERMAAGWVPLRAQIVSGKRLMNRGLIRLDWGPQGTPNENRMCWHLTAKGREIVSAPVT